MNRFISLFMTMSIVLSAVLVPSSYAAMAAPRSVPEMAVNAPTIWRVVRGGAGTHSGADWANAKDLQEALESAVPNTETEIWVQEGTYTPAGPGLDGTTMGDDFTFAAWVNWDGGDPWQRIFDFGQDTTHNMFLTPKSGDGTLRFAITDGGGAGEQKLNASFALTTSAWVHVAVTLEDATDTGTLYVNGAVIASSNTITLTPAAVVGKNMWLGKSQYADPYYQGKLDEVAVFNRALSAAEIENIYNNGMASPPSGAILLLQLEETSASYGTLLLDSSGNSNHATLVTNDGTANKMQDNGSGGKVLALDGTWDYVSLSLCSDATFRLKNGVAIYGGFPAGGGDGTFDARDWVAYPTVLSGDIEQNDVTDSYGVVTDPSGITGTNSLHVVTTSGTDPSAMLDGFTITAGVEGNESGGAGIYNDSGNPTLTDIVIRGNSASGGAMYNEDGTPTLTNVTFADNEAWAGGGLYNVSGNPSLTNVTFSANSASEAGGMFSYGGSPTLTNVTFSGNSATSQHSGGGGGLYNVNGNPTLVNVTFYGNSSALHGGGISNNGGVLEVANAIFWGNTAGGNGSQIYNSEASTNIRYSLIQNAFPSDSWDPNLGTNGGGNLEGDPVLGPLSDNGGSTWTHALPPGSPAVDAGDENPNSCPATDQRGVLRPQDGDLDSARRCDMGAYELRTNNPPTDIALFPSSITEQQPVDTIVGLFSTEDANDGDMHTYSLVTGEGSDGNDAFRIDGRKLKTAVVLDVDVQNSYAIRIRSTDVVGEFVEKQFTIEVLSADDSPLAATDSVTTDEDIEVNIPVLENDKGQREGEVLTLLSVSQPAHGNAVIQGEEVRYKPEPNFNGNDSFFYKVKSEGEAQATGNVFVEVEAVDDPPSQIHLSGSSVPENQPPGFTVGDLSSSDPDGDSTFQYDLVSGIGSDDNRAFRIDGAVLRTAIGFDFETKSSHSIRVQSKDLTGLATQQTFSIRVDDTNDGPTAIHLSPDLVMENKPAGTEVGKLTASDPDVGDDHTYSLVSGSGSDDNGRFDIQGNSLQTAEELDYEYRTRQSIRVRAADGQGASTEEQLVVRVQDEPGDPTNVLTNCNSDTIALFTGDNSVTIEAVEVSDVQLEQCTIEGKMRVRANGAEVGNIAFRGRVNEQNQVLSNDPDLGDSIADFEIQIVGLVFRARDVVIDYYVERPMLRIYDPGIRVPGEWGGLSRDISNPTIIDGGGLKLGSGLFELPSLKIDDTYELALSGQLIAVPGGFEIEAQGTLTIPGMSKKKGQKTSSDSDGGECEINARVRIYIGAQGQTEMRLDASTDLPNSVMAAGPSSSDGFALREIEVGLECSEGIPIGNTGFALKAVSGTVSLYPGKQFIEIATTIATVKDLAGMSLIKAEGSATVTLQPDFKLELKADLYVLIFKMAAARATLTPTSFSTTVVIRTVITEAGFSINAWTDDGRFHFTGSGYARIKISRGDIWTGCSPSWRCPTKVCLKWGFIPYPCRWRWCRGICIYIPPFSFKSPSVNADFGEFRNGAYGFKGYVSIAGSSWGFYVDHRGRVKFGNVTQYALVQRDAVAANLATLRAAQAADMTINPAAFDQRFSYPDDNTVIISTPVRPETGMVIPARHGDMLAASDVISKVSVIQETDLSFQLTSEGPLDMSLIAPNGDEITKHDYVSNPTYTIEYTSTQRYELEREAGENEASQARLRFTAASPHPAYAEVDVSVDDVLVYEAVRFDAARQLEYVTITPGHHAVSILSSTDAAVLATVDLDAEAGKEYSVVVLGKTDPALVVVDDDNRAPEEQDASRVRFLNGAATGAPARLEVDGAPLTADTESRQASAYQLVPAGKHMIRISDRDGKQLSDEMELEFLEGHVYTLISADLEINGFPVAYLQRLDESYVTQYESQFDVDQAPMGDWKVKLSGDLENTNYMLSVSGIPNPPVLDRITVDASDLNQSNVSWVLLSDYTPTNVSVFLTNGPTSKEVEVPDGQGGLVTEIAPLYEGFRVAEFTIDDKNDFGKPLTRVIDLSKLESGDYYLWIRAEDGVNPPVNGYASLPGVQAAEVSAVRVAKSGYDPLAQLADAAVVHVDNTGSFPKSWTPPLRSTLNITRGQLYVEWDAADHPDVDNYEVIMATVSSKVEERIHAGGAFDSLDENGEPTGQKFGAATLHNVNAGETYHISVVARDEESGQQVRSPETAITVRTGDFRLRTSQASYTILPGENGTVQLELDVLETLFSSYVNLTVDLSGAPRGVSAQFGDDISGVASLGVETPRVDVAVAVDSTVADGRYPITFGAYSGDVQRSVTFELVVGVPSEIIYLPAVSHRAQPTDDNRAFLFLPAVVR